MVALLGPNGAGKTTLLRTVSGLLPWSTGEVKFAGSDLRGVGARETMRRGLAHVLEGHRVFTQLSVSDNLSLAGYDLPRSERRIRVEEALSFFPEIAAKRNDRAGGLSDGRVRKMLAVAQLVRQAALPMLTNHRQGFRLLVDRAAVARQLRESGTAILLVEQLIERRLLWRDHVRIGTRAYCSAGSDNRTRSAPPP